MGVRGLSSFMNEHGTFQETHIKDKGRIIIDGNNLRFFLVGRRVNAHYGMDYDKYGHFVREWFTRVIEQGNSLILVFDGVGEDNKEKTRISRKKDCIRNSVHVNPGNSRAHVSILSKDVFVAIAKSFPPSDILVLQTNYECDNIMASLAKKLNAPVLTNDSDFYIFNVEFLPLHSLDIDSLKCSRFDKNAFMKKFKLSNESTIYLMASLIGNDYIPRKLLYHFYSQIHFPYKTKKMSPSIKNIFALLFWLGRSQSMEQAMESLLSTFPQNKRDKLESLIKESIRVYNGENIQSSFQSLESLEDIQNFVKDVDKPLVDPDGNPLSDGFLELFHSLDVDSWVGNVFANRILSIPTPVEEKTEETGLLLCLPIYKKIVELMTQTKGATIKCLMRKKASLQIMYLEIDNPLHQSLDSDESKLNIICETVGLTMSQYQILSASFQPDTHVLLLALHYYSSLRKGSSLYIKSLIVLLLLKVPEALGESGTFEGLNDNFTNRMKSFYHDSLKKTRSSTFNRVIVHEFSLIQWCIHAIYHLNVLLRNPLSPTLPVMDFWNGTFLYNFTNDILSYMDRDGRFNSLLTLRGSESEIDQKMIQSMERVTTRLSNALPNFNLKLGVSSSGKKSRNRKNKSNPQE